MRKLTNHDLLLDIVERLSKMEKDIEYTKEHIEVINREHGEVCDRLEVLEDKRLTVDVSWKVLGKLGGSIVTIIGVASIILKLIGVV